MRITPVIFAAALLSSCTTAPPSPEIFSAANPVINPAINPAKLVDLSYAYDEKTIYWPNAEGFRHRKDTWKVTPNGYWYAAGEFTSAEHGGTHIDSPIHFAQGKQALDQIPVGKLIAPAVVIDIATKAAAFRDYRASLTDIADFEMAHGPIPAGSIVVFRTGWGKFWPDRKQYLGSDVKGDVEHLHFPGILQDTAKLLVERKVNGVAIDTASLDYGPSKDFITHQTLTAANIFGLENLANADQLPITGATLIALPMKIAEGSGGPARVVALLP
ncbi:MAG: cyclase family protein [Acidobacteriota bacterium]